MNEKYHQILNRIEELEDELFDEIHRQKQRMGYEIENGKVVFQQKMVDAHKQLKTNVIPWLLNSKSKSLLSIPFIYALIIPLVMLDIFVTIYHFVGFSLYNIAKVKRKNYFVYDRHLLQYLNAIQKINCFYCSYANGVISYTREIASRTEQYWCPIKHSQKISHPHARYANFVDYGEGEEYAEHAKKLRATLKPQDENETAP